MYCSTTVRESGWAQYKHCCSCTGSHNPVLWNKRKDDLKSVSANPIIPSRESGFDLCGFERRNQLSSVIGRAIRWQRAPRLAHAIAQHRHAHMKSAFADLRCGKSRDLRSDLNEANLFLMNAESYPTGSHTPRRQIGTGSNRTKHIPAMLPNSLTRLKKLSRTPHRWLPSLLFVSWFVVPLSHVFSRHSYVERVHAP